MSQSDKWSFRRDTKFLPLFLDDSDRECNLFPNSFLQFHPEYG